MAIPLRALIVEDSENDALLLARELQRGGYDLTYERVDSLEAMKAALEKQQWNIVLSDYTMPHFRGTDALLLLRERDSDTPFIYISGTIGEDMAVAAMKAGANDYVLKGNLKRLVPAIRRELREAEGRRQRKRAEEERRLLQSLALAIARAENLNSALNEVLEKICTSTGWSIGEAWMPSADGRVMERCPAWWGKAEGFEKFRERTKELRFGMGQGLVGRAWASRKPIWVADVMAEPSFLRAQAAKEVGIKTGVAIPVLIVHEVVAILFFFSLETHGDDVPFLELVSAVAAQLGTIIKRRQLEDQAQRNLERIRALHEIDTAISSTLDLRSVLNVLLEKVDHFFPYPTASTVRLMNEETGFLEALACRGLNEEEWKAQDSRSLGGRAKKVVETKAPLTVRNVQTAPQTSKPEMFRKYGLVSHLGVPLIAKNKTLGVLGLYTKQEHEFSPEEIEFFNTLADRAAIAIHNARLYEQMAKANKIKDEILSVMSHELRTPLNVVVGYAGMIRDGLLGEVNPQQEEALRKMMDRANDQLALVNNILYATVLETEKITVESNAVVLGDFLKQLSSAYENPLNKQLAFSWNCPSPLEVIHTDSAKLKQILRNLIDNALKFTEKGSITVSARVTEGSSEILPTADRLLPAGRVEFNVSDTGVGIPKDAMPFIFDKFRQVDSSETRSFGGVGMGLYIAKKFAQLLGGTVEVESEAGKGSAFTVKIPVEK